MLDFIREKVRSLENSIIKTRRDIHKHPETAWKEFRTSALAIKKMKELGYRITMGEKAADRKAAQGLPDEETTQREIERAVLQGADPAILKEMEGLTGFWADMDFGGEGANLALRFDMDANDVTECSEACHRPANEGFSSINEGAMHACGHDAHVAIGLAVAEITAAIKNKLKGSVRFIFQPAEEGSKGALPMTKAGAADKADYIIGLHIGFQADNKESLVCGTKGFLASTKWNVKFKGVPAHAGAAPQEGRNAMLAACSAVLNLHAISRHGDGVTRINVGKLTAGEGRNVIPCEALMIMETRGYTSQLNDYMTTEAGRIIKAAAEMHGCSYEIKSEGTTKSGESSPELAELIYKTAKKIGLYTNITKIKDFGAGEDYTHMMDAVLKNGGKGTYIQVGIDRAAGHHSDKFDFDESCLFPAAELLSAAIFEILKK